MNLMEITKIKKRKTLRSSSWDQSGKNGDFWAILPGKTTVLADIRGAGVITHIWMTQSMNYRECLLKITWDDSETPSVLCPLGDFFGLGHSIVNSYQSLLFTSSVNTDCENKFNVGAALNCYVPMPFKKRALIELINESNVTHNQYFYIDYELADPSELAETGYFHTEFRRSCPFPGWGPHILVNSASASAIVNKESDAWNNNYVILETSGCGHYIGCNISVTNIQGTWWGEGDDMIWVDGYKWPPDLHGTGSEDYLNQAWGMQPNAFLRNGSSLYENKTGGYQTSYVHHIENPVHFEKEIKVTIEHGHANHLKNEMSSVAYWFAAKPTKVMTPPPVEKRKPIMKILNNFVIPDHVKNTTNQPVEISSPENQYALELWEKEKSAMQNGRLTDKHSPFIINWMFMPAPEQCEFENAPYMAQNPKNEWKLLPSWPTIGCNRYPPDHNIVDWAHLIKFPGIVYLTKRFKTEAPGKWLLDIGHKGKIKLFINGTPVEIREYSDKSLWITSYATVEFETGEHEIMIATDSSPDNHYMYCCFELADPYEAKTVFPIPV